jgi:hypoxanthine phosphoribosyltransferase
MFDDKKDLTPKLLIPEIQIKKRLVELAHEIAHDYQGREVVAVCVLKGSFVFFSDLIRQMDLPITCEFLGVSSYGNKMVSSGEVKVTLDINEPLEGKHVLVIEDIVDTGLTLYYIMSALKARKPASLKSCSLMLKPDCLKTEIDVDYVGFRIGSEFVVGYGVDFAGKFRELPYIGYLEQGH